jgi:predicted DsbA family dithiol-disulfide isomerase
MHDALLDHQGDLAPRDLIAYADELGLDVERFEHDLRHHKGAGRVEEDVDSADRSGVAGTPTFFINERRHEGAYDVASLEAAVRNAGARAVVAG